MCHSSPLRNSQPLEPRTCKSCCDDFRSILVDYGVRVPREITYCNMRKRALTLANATETMVKPWTQDVRGETLCTPLAAASEVAIVILLMDIFDQSIAAPKRIYQQWHSFVNKREESPQALKIMWKEQCSSVLSLARPWENQRKGKCNVGL